MHKRELIETSVTKCNVYMHSNNDDNYKINENRQNENDNKKQKMCAIPLAVAFSTELAKPF